MGERPRSGPQLDGPHEGAGHRDRVHRRRDDRRTRSSHRRPVLPAREQLPEPSAAGRIGLVHRRRPRLLPGLPRLRGPGDRGRARPRAPRPSGFHERNDQLRLGDHRAARNSHQHRLRLTGRDSGGSRHRRGCPRRSGQALERRSSSHRCERSHQLRGPPPGQLHDHRLPRSERSQRALRFLPEPERAASRPDPHPRPPRRGRRHGVRRHRENARRGRGDRRAERIDLGWWASGTLDDRKRDRRSRPVLLPRHPRRTVRADGGPVRLAPSGPRRGIRHRHLPDRPGRHGARGRGHGALPGLREAHERRRSGRHGVSDLQHHAHSGLCLCLHPHRPRSCDRHLGLPICPGGTSGICIRAGARRRTEKRRYVAPEPDRPRLGPRLGNCVRPVPPRARPEGRRDRPRPRRRQPTHRRSIGSGQCARHELPIGHGRRWNRDLLCRAGRFDQRHRHRARRGKCGSRPRDPDLRRPDSRHGHRPRACRVGARHRARAGTE